MNITWDQMATYGMDVMLSPGEGGEKDVLGPVSRDWRRGATVRTYEGRQRPDMPPLIHHKSYSAGLCTQIPSLPTARQSVSINRALPDKPKGPRTSPYGWRKSDKYNMPYEAKDSRHASRYINHAPTATALRKDVGHYPRRNSAQFSDIAAYHSPIGSGNVPSLTSCVDTSMATKNRHPNTVSWNLTLDTSPIPGSSSKHHLPGSSWTSAKENDKELWENRMRENQELLRLYKHGFPSLNQTRAPASSPGRPAINNGYSDETMTEVHTHTHRSKDKIYQEMDPITDIVNYEPLSKSVQNSSRVPYNHPVSRIINGYRSNPGIMTANSPYPSPRLAGESSKSYNDHHSPNYTYTFDIPKSPRIKHWGTRNLSSISERLNPQPPPPPPPQQQHGTRSAFSRPESYKSLTSLEELHKIEKSLNSPENSNKPTDLLISELSNGKSIPSPVKDDPKLVRRHSTNGHTTPFKTQMKRSLAIYLGVDPEIDTVQYQPLNKSLQKLHANSRHVFSSQYCRVQEYGRKDDRDMRVQSKKKSVYSCGYDVSSINVMLQNAKKRFKCAEG